MSQTRGLTLPSSRTGRGNSLTAWLSSYKRKSQQPSSPSHPVCSPDSGHKGLTCNPKDEKRATVLSLGSLEKRMGCLYRQSGIWCSISLGGGASAENGSKEKTSGSTERGLFPKEAPIWESLRAQLSPRPETRPRNPKRFSSASGAGKRKRMAFRFIFRTHRG